MASTKLAIYLLVVLLVAGLAGVSSSAPLASSQPGQTGQEGVQDVPTWQQSNANGFGNPDAGEVSALGAFNGFLYAGTHNPVDLTMILRSSNGITWTEVIDPGFGIPHDTAPPAILAMTVFNSRLYASTGRGGNPGQIWRTLNGVNWAPMVNAGFSNPDTVDIAALTVYDNTIYAGAANLVSGAQIWRSFTGDSNTWEQVAPAVPGTDVASVTGFATFDGGLYASIESAGPAQIWVSYGGSVWTTAMDDGFGDSQTTSIGGMAVLGNALYVGAGNTSSGAQLWRSSDGTLWEPVTVPGLADPGNEMVEIVFVFENQLYVSAKNASTGIQLWRSMDGILWERANLDGFGDINNTGSNKSNAVEAFLFQLYVGTSNVVDGGELWQMEPQNPTPTPTQSPTATGSPPTPTPTLPGPSPTPSPTPPPVLKMYLPVVVR